MPQIFSRAADMRLRLVALVAILIGLAAVSVGAGVVRSDYWERVGWFREQPVPFSHEHHVSGLGIDCRYCHTTVETAQHAGYPPTHTCMTCHSQIWTGAKMLEPVRASLANDTPLHWNRVVEMPDYVYFHHGVHVQAGVGCVTCHGRVDRMPLTFQAKSLTMKWCVACHRDPAPHLRPREAVTDMKWKPEGDRRALGEKLLARLGIHERLDHCYTCHR